MVECWELSTLVLMGCGGLPGKFLKLTLKLCTNMISKLHFISLNETEVKQNRPITTWHCHNIYSQKIIIYNLLIKRLLHDTLEISFKYFSIKYSTI